MNRETFHEMHDAATAQMNAELMAVKKLPVSERKTERAIIRGARLIAGDTINEAYALTAKEN